MISNGMPTSTVEEFRWGASILRGENLMAVSRTKIPLAEPILDEEMKEAAIQALQNERFVLGESVFKFEEEFARYCGTKFAVSTASGTAALTMALVALRLNAGEVLTSPASFVASSNSIINAGATPTFADITLANYTLDPERVIGSLGEKSKALLPIHLYGYPAAMDELCTIAEEHNLVVVEDACQAHGALYNGKKVGSIGKIGCFSFYPSKNITVGGDGGMIVTNDEGVAVMACSLRDCGRLKGTKYVHNIIGYTERLNTVQAAIGRIQLIRLDRWNEKRRDIARRYDRLLSDLEDIIIPPGQDSKSLPAYYMYVIRCRQRDHLRAWLNDAGIECGVHFPYPIHLQPVYRERYGYENGAFPNSEKLCSEALSIPMHPSLSENDIRFVSQSIHDFYHNKVG